MKYETTSLEGEALDKAVALALGWMPLGSHWWEPGTVEKDGGLVRQDGKGSSCLRSVEMYSREWVHGGPIIESERIVLHLSGDGWCAMVGGEYGPLAEGSTALIAAMRAFVASRFGDTVEMP